LIDTKATGRDGQQPAIRRDFIANGDGDYIAWDKLGGVNTGNLAGSKGFCLVGGILLESLGGSR